MNSNIIPNNRTLIVGLSGGPDSVYLLHQLVALAQEKQLTLIAAHLNHEWRAEAAQDAEFCKNLSSKLGLLCVTKKISELGITFKQNGSKEELGRKYRRHFLESVAEKYNAKGILLAHHADDQQETFFLRMIRGTTVSGLVGMQEVDGLYIRPLLHMPKQYILDYLTTKQLTFLQDSTNESSDFLRNRIRQTVIPALRIVDARFDMKHQSLIKSITETEQFLQTHTDMIYKTIIIDEKLDIKAFNMLDIYLQKRILLMWFIAHKLQFNLSEKFLQEILRFFKNSKNRSHKIHTTWNMYKEKNKASIQKQFSEN